MSETTKIDTVAAEIASALNRACLENESNTPDFILAAYLLKALEAFDLATRQRERWYGRSPNDSPFVTRLTRAEAERKLTDDGLIRAMAIAFGEDLPAMRQALLALLYDEKRQP